MSHECPYPPCELQVADEMFACRPHWFLLPKQLRRQIWDAWDCGDWQGHRGAKIEAAKFYQGHVRLLKAPDGSA